MKNFILFLFSICLFAINSNAQTVKTVKVNTPSVQCESCKKRVETYLKRYDGVAYINVNVKKKETTVKYVTDRINEEEIKTAITNAGYDANEMVANPDSYKRLPQCCKKPEDGGGM